MFRFNGWSRSGHAAGINASIATVATAVITGARVQWTLRRRDHRGDCPPPHIERSDLGHSRLRGNDALPGARMLPDELDCPRGSFCWAAATDIALRNSSSVDDLEWFENGRSPVSIEAQRFGLTPIIDPLPSGNSAEFSMLETLDSVNWSELSHAYGPASDVPGLIRNLLSDDVSVRDEACWQLWGNIIHQGTVYEATAWAVPFFLELLDSPKVHHKPQILELLAALGSGSSYCESHKEVFQNVPGLRQKTESAEWDEQQRQELGWVTAAYDAVVQGWEVYLERLNDADPGTRAAAAYALAICSEYSAAIEQRLRAVLADEIEPSVQASLLLCLGCLGGAGCESFLDEWLRKSVHRTVATSAALSLARVIPDRLAVDVVEILVDCLRNPEPVDEVYLTLPWSDGQSIVAAASQVLCQLGPASANALIPQFAEGLNNLRPRDSASIFVVRALLSLAFEPRKTLRLAPELSRSQRDVLRVLVESERAWDSGNVFFELREFGLPGDRLTLAELAVP